MDITLPVNLSKRANEALVISLFSKRTIIILAFNTAFCTLIAVLLWLFSYSLEKDRFVDELIFSQSIGQSICLLYLLWSQLKQKAPFQGQLANILAHPVIISVGFLTGNTLASMLVIASDHPVNAEQIIITSLTTTILASAFSLWFYSNRRRMSLLEIKSAEESEQTSIARLSMLQAQIEPHMLFNTLANLRTLVQTDPDKALLMLDQLIEFFRSTLDNSRAVSTSLANEFCVLQNYLALMKVRLDDRLTYTLTLPEELSDIQVPALILQPLVENAIIHGIEPSIKGGKVTVTASMTGDLVILSVIDTGVGIDTHPTENPTGFGLQSVRDRLTLANNGANPLTIQSPLAVNVTGTAVTVTLPANLNISE